MIVIMLLIRNHRSLILIQELYIVVSCLGGLLSSQMDVKALFKLVVFCFLPHSWRYLNPNTCQNGMLPPFGAIESQYSYFTFVT